MAIDVYFSRPGRIREIQDRIKIDMKYASTRILIAQYSFEDKYIVREFLKSSATDKRIIVDQANYNDLIEKIDSEFGTPELSGCTFDKQNITRLGHSHSEDHYASLMHHKFMIADNTLWTGSYNFSLNASQGNWENCQRITDAPLVEQYVAEFSRMYIFSKSINNKLIHKKCKNCGAVVEEPFKHFSISVDFISRWFERRPYNCSELDGPPFDTDIMSDEHGGLYDQQTIEWIHETTYLGPKVHYQATCKKTISEVGTCSVCNGKVNLSDLNQISVVREYERESVPFMWGVYADDHERAGQVEWVREPNKEVARESESLKVRTDYVCTDCLDATVLDRIRQAGQSS